MHTPTRLAPNRSMPAGPVIPVLAYDDVLAAAAWLVRCFGFEERLRIGTHRVQLTIGAGAVVASARPEGAASTGAQGHAVMVRVADVDAHYAHAMASGVELGPPPETYPYGERQYSARDLGGHTWTFSQTVDDVEPAAWGGEWPTRPSDSPR